MTREHALALLKEYSDFVEERFGGMDINPNNAKESALASVMGVHDRFPDDGSEKKAMRWLGWAQGVLQACGVFTLEALKEHSRTRSIWQSSGY